ncbi:MAG: GGDEF domain-containing protein [Deltaproteobacteria bacterium]|nr:GGDEF domain-containing protein [Deltaproteobacteria bacterium]
MSQLQRKLFVAFLILGIGFLHFSCQLYLVEHTKLHNVFLTLLYIPIILAAFWWGLRGGDIVGLICAAIDTVELVRWWNPEDPNHYNRVAEPMIFLFLGLLLGFLIDRERRAKQEKLLAEARAEQEFQKAIQDPLTLAYNRRHLDKTLEEFWSMAREGSAPFSLLMIDLNNFKTINDRFGHPVGDRVLVSTVQNLFNNTRKTDMAFRCGGDEFILLLPMTRGEFALSLASRLREEFAKLTFRGADRDNFKADFSIGVIEYHPELASLQDMLQKLDDALYRAKKEVGRIALAG